MCRGARSAHGSRSAEHRHSRKNPGTARKTRSRPVGATLSDVQHHRTGREERPPNRQRPSSRRSTPARAGKSSLTEAPLPSDEAAPPQPAREDRTLGPAGRGASAAPPHGPGRTRPARQRPSAPAPARSPNPTRTPRKTAPTAPIPDPGPRTPDPDGKGPLGPFAMSRGSLPGRPRCDTTTPRPRPLRRRRQRPCFRRPSRGPPRVPGPGSGEHTGPPDRGSRIRAGCWSHLPRPRHPLRRADREDGSGTSPLPPRGRGEAATPTRRPARGTAAPRGRVEGGRGDGVSRRSLPAERPPRPPVA